MALNARQTLFVKEYLVDLNATQAAIRAGYSEKTAYSIGEENLKKPDIAAAVKAEMDKRSEKIGITAEAVISDLMQLRDMCMGRVAVNQTVLIKDSEGGSVPVEVSQKVFEPAGAKGALELLGKHLKLFTDKVEQTGKDGNAQEHNITVSMTDVNINKLREKLNDIAIA